VHNKLTTRVIVSVKCYLRKGAGEMIEMCIIAFNSPLELFIMIKKYNSVYCKFYGKVDGIGIAKRLSVSMKLGLEQRICLLVLQIV
jgi:hypothetical protein